MEKSKSNMYISDLLSKPRINLSNSLSTQSMQSTQSTQSTLSSQMNSFKKMLKDNKIDMKLMLISLLIIVLICIIIYITICLVHYYKSTCHIKKTLLSYLFDFSNNEVCSQENEPDSEPIEATVLPPEKNPFDLLANFEKKSEVYHISNQDYTYEQAKCKCESYNGRLATKPEIIDAYNKGANWCTYGWTEKNTAYYPVQQCYWDKLKIENERLPEHAKKYCGMPGVNGGSFANNLIKFGANCFGVKPKGELNKEKKPFCPPMNFCKLDSNFEASHKLDSDEIVGFNNDSWNEKII